MLPEYVAGIGRRYGQKFLFTQFDHFTASHLAERTEVHGEQRELVLGPIEPIDDMLLCPLAGIYTERNGRGE